MWISDQWQDFELIDCSGGEKLERWGSYTVVRPDPQAIWQTPRNRSEWNRQGGHYKRSSTGGGKWDRGNLPSDWTIGYKDLTFQVKPMNFKHMGLFPEQATNWDWAMEQIRNADREISVLNLFAYTGAATVACLKAGASVCHVDAAKGMVAWAKQNAQVSGVIDRPVRWIVDDCAKFVEREIRRGHHYDAIIMDPPSYGRGPGGEVWKLENDLWDSGKRSVGFRVPDGQCPVGQSAVRFNQHLYHGPQPVGTDLYVGEHLYQTIRFRCFRQPGTGPSGDGIRSGPALRVQLPLAAPRLKESMIYECDHSN